MLARRIVLSLTILVAAPASGAEAAAAKRRTPPKSCSPKGYHVVYAAGRARVLKRNGQPGYRSCDTKSKRIWNLDTHTINGFGHAGPWLLFHRSIRGGRELVAHDIESGGERRAFTDSLGLALGDALITRGGTVVYLATNVAGPGVVAVYADTADGRTIRLDTGPLAAGSGAAVLIGSLAVAERSGELAPIAYWRRADGTTSSVEVPY